MSNRVIEIPDEGLIEPEPPSPYNFWMDVRSLPIGWEARIKLNGGMAKFWHKDRRELIRGIVKHCTNRIIQTVPVGDVEMVLQAFNEYIEKEEREYYQANLSNPSFN